MDSTTPDFLGADSLLGFSKHSYQIIGVVQGYKEDTAKILVGGRQVDTQLLVNSGILVGYSISHAIKAIEDDQKHRNDKIASGCSTTYFQFIDGLVNAIADDVFRFWWTVLIPFRNRPCLQRASFSGLWVR